MGISISFWPPAALRGFFEDFCGPSPFTRHAAPPDLQTLQIDCSLYYFYWDRPPFRHYERLLQFGIPAVSTVIMPDMMSWKRMR
jgi:hypothetical protein